MLLAFAVAASARKTSWPLCAFRLTVKHVLNKKKERTHSDDKVLYALKCKGHERTKWIKDFRWCIPRDKLGKQLLCAFRLTVKLVLNKTKEQTSSDDNVLYALKCK